MANNNSLVIAVIGILVLAGVVGTIVSNPIGEAAKSSTAASKCTSDKNCYKIICTAVVGGDKPKCDLRTGTCYCGGICGDNYCDSVEKRDGTCNNDCQPIEAYFMFMIVGYPETFIFKLTDPIRIQEARDILAKKITDRTHVMGIIVKKPANYNSPWSYYLGPTTITFFEFATEVCDAGMVFVEEHLNEVGGALLPNNKWCPWRSVLVREVNPPDVSI
jgi:hypothetical protein